MSCFLNFIIEIIYLRYILVNNKVTNSIKINNIDFKIYERTKVQCVKLDVQPKAHGLY